jgi:hypothetical protein
MRIQDLKVVYICPDHNEKYRERKVHMDTMLSNLGFNDVEHHVSGTETYPMCLSKATIDILTKHVSTPVLILEDDVEYTGVEEFDFVHDADAIYFGASRSGGHPDKNEHLGFARFDRYSDSQVRLTSMLGTHAILYISERYKRAVINALVDAPGYNDVCIARIQSDFKVLANINPSFYQGSKFNTGNHEESFTRFTLVRTALHLIATNKYTAFLPDMVRSANKHFFPDTLRRIVIYSDVPITYDFANPYPSLDIEYVTIRHEPWPYVTLKRFHSFASYHDGVEYSFYCDVDAEFVKTMTLKTISKSMYGTIHPGWAGTRGTPCSNPSSTSCIPPGGNNAYYCGGFFGGEHSKFMSMSRELAGRIQADINRGVMADWHDESHLNWYFWQNPPSVFAYPFALQEDVPIQNATHIVFLDKAKRGGHQKYRDTPPPQQRPTPGPFRLRFTGSGFKHR